MTLEIIILSVLMLSALWSVMTRSILRSAIGLAFVSVMLTYIMFRLSSPIAAVFELSVCTGLISVVFISTITLTYPLSKQEVLEHMKERLSRFWYLPLILLLVGIAFSLAQVKLNLTLPPPGAEKDVRDVLWKIRPLDLAGQAIMLLAGAYGVLILFRQVRKK